MLRPPARREDERLLRGQGCYTADLQRPGMLHAHVIRAAPACGRIVRMDLSQVRSAPGVRLVVTAQELAAWGAQALPCVVTPPGQHTVPMPVLAQSQVRFAGQPLAVVIADSAWAAQEAAELIGLDIEEGEPVVSLAQALAPGAPDVHAQVAGNVSLDFHSGDADAVARALAAAHRTSRLTVRSQRVIGAPMEPRAVLAEYDAAADRVRLTTPSQGVGGMARFLAAASGLAPEQIEVVSHDVGGSFGLRAGPYSEHVVLALAARQLRSPIRWVATRSETMLSDWHGRAITLDATVGLDAHDRIVALHFDTLVDLGAYNAFVSSLVGTRNLAATASGVYQVPALALRSRLVFTHTVPMSAYRGAGRPDIAYAIEALLDHAAAEHGLDRFELRRKNFIAPQAFPYLTANGITYDHCQAERLLQQALELMDVPGFAQRRAQSLAQGRLRGLGLACYIEASGAGAVPQDTVQASFSADGCLDIYGLTGDSGQGHASSFASLAAQELGLPAERVRYQAGSRGLRLLANGTEGSRTLYGAGSAVLDACRKLRRQAQAMGQHGQGPIDWLPWLARLDAAQLDLLQAQGLAQSGPTFPNGCHAVELEIDPRTGVCVILDYVAVDDVGRAVSPQLIHGQLQGGVVQGWGQAFAEQAVYDAQGQLLTGSFMDYGMPRLGCMPGLRSQLVELATSLNQVGAKGVGEAGCTGSLPAFHNAVLDALRPRGIVQLDMPFTPARLWAALHPEAAAG
ncbi:MAG: xanthine dehydrogenase family protein molybdopterin-binding subunit [Betaproteobacteria bacterium]